MYSLPARRPCRRFFTATGASAAKRIIRITFDAVSASVQRICPITHEDVEEARRLGERTAGGSGASARDLVHAAVARRQGVREILTVDAGFASIPGVVVVDPLDWARNL